MEKIYPPLAILKEITRVMPKVWQIIDVSRPIGVQNSGCPDRCFAPIETATAASIFCQESAAGKKGADIDIPQPRLTLALAQWRKDKEVFVIDPDLAAVLYAQDDMDIPAAAFDYLPYSCFYVESPGLDVYLTGIHGFFFYLGWDTKEQKVLLSFVFLGESGGCYPFDLPLDGESLDVCFDAAVKKRAQSGNAHLATVARQEQKQRDAVISLLRCALQVVLYLCASNAEIVPDPEQKTVTKHSRTVKDRYAEIRKWDVGMRVGASLREQSRRAADEDAPARTGSHQQKRPHMRRGHWHHFWTGSKSEPDKRKLVLKWLSPIFVGAVDAETPVVMHKVKEV